MRILFTGATGVLGRAAVPLLVADGHTIDAVARNQRDHEWLRRIGANPVEVDLFEAGSVDRAVRDSETVIHFATAIPQLAEMAKRTAWAMNDRLRSEATRILVDAALHHGVSRFVQQSVTLVYADGGAAWLDEDSPIAPPWEIVRSALEAEAHVDRFRQGGGDGTTLRLSRLYGPGPVSAEYLEAVRSRKVPIVGRGDNYVSSIHVDDAAAALVAAMTAPGAVYNVTDDSPTRAAEYTESLADLLGAIRPRHIPRLVARLALGGAVTLLTTSHRVSNVRLHEATGWSPAFSSVVDGWRDMVTGDG